MSRPDAERALQIYKTFGRQTELVVQYLSMARQYEQHTRLEVPRLKHAPTTLTNALEEYLNDADFESNRKQYLGQQDTKKSGKPAQSAPSSNAFSASAAKQPATSSVESKPPPTQTQAKGPAPDLIDFFDSIEQNQQVMNTTNFAPQQQFQPQQQVYQQAPMPQQGFNPFLQQQPPPPQQQPVFQSQALPQPQQLQTDFTGAGFGGYGPQPPQQQVQSPNQFQYGSQLSSIPQNGIPDFQSQALATSPPPQLQPQQTSTNPFRQSTMNTGNPVFSPISPAAPTRSNTNPFARSNTGAGTNGGFPNDQSVISPLSASPQNAFPPNQPFTTSPPALQPQRTGTNPFAKSVSATPTSAINTNITGSTNPFRQSAFVNQQTGQGWQHSSQGTFSGFDVNQVDTLPVFPRPGHG
jgi:phosphatidylinositol-binding clathrin assembly protein